MEREARPVSIIQRARRAHPPAAEAAAVARMTFQGDGTLVLPVTYVPVSDRKSRPLSHGTGGDPVPEKTDYGPTGNVAEIDLRR